MKHCLQPTKAALLIFLLCVSLMAPLAHAADTISVKIPFVIKLSGDIPSENENYTIILQAQADTIPMPTGSIGNTYSATVSGAGDFHFPAILYPRVGIYSYQVRQKSSSNPFCTYDATVYNATVFVTNREDSHGLESTVVVSRADTPQEKCTLAFENVYRSPAPPVNIAVIKKWVDNGTNRPASVMVQLLQDGAVYDSVVLSAGNNWRHSWTGLSGKHQWNIVEPNVPAHYTASYQLENGVYTITNTAALIQTGQLRWPIWVLSSLGVLLVLLGLILHIKRKHEDA